MPSTKTMFRAVALLLIVVTLAGAWNNARAVDAILVTLNEGSEEPADLALGDAALPDYRLEVEVAGDWEKIGTRRDTSAKDGLTFEVVERLALSKLTQIRLSEEDKVDDDAIETVSLEDDAVGGDRHLLRGPDFTYQINDRFDAQVGISWMIRTPVGMLLMLGVLIFLLLAALRGGLANWGDLGDLT